VQQVNRTKKSL